MSLGRVVIVLVASVAILRADDPKAPFKGVVILKDGRHIEGTITVRADSSVDVELTFGSVHFKAEEEEPPLTGDWAVTKEGRQPDYTDPAIKARIEEANQAFEASLAHYEAFRRSKDDGIRAKEIGDCLSQIRKAAGGYASVFDVLPSDRWLEDRYRRAIEVLKVVRMQAAQYR